jgi:hypothetical protein
VDVRWTRIEEMVIMDWLIRRNEPGSRIFFNASSLPNPARGGVTILSTDLKSPTGDISIALPALVDVGTNS